MAIRQSAEDYLETILVLSGVSSLDDIDSMPFRPSWIYPSVAEIDVI